MKSSKMKSSALLQMSCIVMIGCLGCWMEMLEIDMIIISKSTISISRARNSIVLLNLISKVALAVVSARRMACPTS